MKRNERGQALVEMAIVLPVLVLLLFGILEMGRILDAWIVVTNAAREGARYAAVRRPAVEVVDRTFAYLEDGLGGRGDVTYSRAWISVDNPVGVPGTAVSVTARVELRVFTPLFQAIMTDPFPVGRTATMKMQ